jgi:hypothetical protein
VRGRGLDAELGGDLKVTGSLADPKVVGAFDLRRGRLSVLGRRLDFTRGHVGFSGGCGFGLRARHEVRDVRDVSDKIGCWYWDRADYRGAALFADSLALELWLGAPLSKPGMDRLSQPCCN